jgi:hypothetical protein
MHSLPEVHRYTPIAFPNGRSNAAALQDEQEMNFLGVSCVEDTAITASSPLAAVGSAALVQTSGGDFLVAHTSQSVFVALSAICTHQT